MVGFITNMYGIDALFLGFPATRVTIGGAKKSGYIACVAVLALASCWKALNLQLRQQEFWAPA